MKERNVEVRVHWGDELLEVENVSRARAAEITGRLEGGPLRCEVRPVVVSEGFGPAKMDREPWIYVGASLAFAGLVLVAASFLPPSRAMLTLDQNELASRSVRSLLMEELPPEAPAAAAAFEGDSPVLASGDLGRAGIPDAPVHRARRDPNGAREPDADHGRRSVEVGALAALRTMSGSWSSSSPYAGAAGGNDAVASLMGDRVGESFGFGGLSLSSTGRGAGMQGGTVPLEPRGFGGTGSGSICGCDGFPTLGVSGGGVGFAAAREVEPELRERESHVPERIVTCGCGDLLIAGALSREVIRRVVRRHHEEVRHCYERGLQVRPDLEGRVMTRFTIAPSGEVVASLVESSDVGHAPTETCVARAVRRWSFPAADAGGITNVSYPFVLESR